MDLQKLLDAINAKKLEVQNLVKENKIEEAKAAKEELVNMQAKYDLLADMEDIPAAGSLENTVGFNPAVPRDAIKEFANAARRGFKNTMNEGTGADGGYTVPQDIQTKIEKMRDAKFSLRDLVSVENVKTNTGSRTYKTKAQNTAFKKVAEGTKIGAGKDMQFTRVNYSIDKFGGYFPVTNELLEDSDSAITEALTEWIGDGARATDNENILAVLMAGTATEISYMDDIKQNINVTLGQAYKPYSKIVTNDNGLNMLDTLKDAQKRYLLTPDISNPGKMKLSCGAVSIPIEVIPNTDLSNDVTESFEGDGTTTAFTVKYKICGDPTVYVGGTKLTTGYTASNKTVTFTTAPANDAEVVIVYDAGAPFIIGDLKSGVKLFDRKKISIKASDTAAVTGFNAYEEDMTLFRGIVREDVKAVDSDAWVYLRAASLTVSA